MENDNVAALNGAIREHKAAQPARRPVDLLVEEKKITHEQGALHALRGNEERLQDEGKQEQRDHDGSQQRCAGLSKGGQMIAQMVEVRPGIAVRLRRVARGRGVGHWL